MSWKSAENEATLTPSLAKEGVGVAPARATPTACLQELFE